MEVFPTPTAVPESKKKKVRKTLEDTEEWKKIPGFPHYQCNIKGEVKGNTGKLLKPYGQNGYTMYGLLDENYIQKNNRAHRVVALTWIANDDPKNKTQVNHKDGNKKNNHISNLEWCTPKENMAHYWLQPNACTKRRPLRFTKDDEVLNFTSMKMAAAHFGVALSTIWSATFTGKYRGYLLEHVIESVDKKPLLQSIEAEGSAPIHCHRV